MIAAMRAVLDGRGFFARLPGFLQLTWTHGQIIWPARIVTTTHHQKLLPKRGRRFTTATCGRWDEHGSRVRVRNSNRAWRKQSARGAFALRRFKMFRATVSKTKFNSGATFVWVSRKLPPDKSDAVQALNLKGVYTMKENERFYPKRDMARTFSATSILTKKAGGIEHQLDKQIGARAKNSRHGQTPSSVGSTVARRIATKARHGRPDHRRKIQYSPNAELQAGIAGEPTPSPAPHPQNPNTGGNSFARNWPKFNPNP